MAGDGSEHEAIDPAWWTGAVEEEWDTPELLSFRLQAVGREATPESLEHRVLEALGVATSAMLQPENRAEPFKPAIEIDGRRSPLPADLSEEQVQLLATVVRLVENVPLRARVADVAWSYGNRKDLHLLSDAIDAYRSMPLQPEVWFRVGRESWQRALDLAQSRGKAEAARIGEMVQAMLDRIKAGVTSDAFMLIDLSELIARFGRLDVATRRDLGEHFVKLAVSASMTNLRLARHFERTACQWFRLSDDETAAHDAMSRVATLYESDAEHRRAGDAGTALAAGMFLEKAIATIRALPRSYREANGLDARLRALREQLSDNREASLEAMIRIETEPIDISRYVSDAQRTISGKDEFEALVALATIQPLIDIEQTRRDAKERLGETLARIFGRSTLAGDGRKVATAKSAVGEPQDQEVWSEVVRFFAYRVGLITAGFIMPGQNVATFEHRYRLSFLQRVCWDSPFVPKGHEDLWARGIWHGLNHDFPSAVSVLVPQVEQAIRLHLKSAGVYTLTVDEAGVESEKGLGALLSTAEASDLLGENLCVELRALLVEQEGDNLRNNVAHGLLDDKQAWSSGAVYTWWLCLRLVVVPLWHMRQETDQPDDPDAETVHNGEAEDGAPAPPAGRSPAEPAP